MRSRGCRGRRASRSPSSAIATDPRFTLLATLAFPPPLTLKGWPRSIAYPGPWIHGGNGFTLSILPGCANPRSGVVVQGKLYVVSLVNTSGTGNCTTSREESVSVVTMFDPMGTNAPLGYPVFNVTRVLDHAHGPHRNAFFLDTSCFRDGDFVFVVGSGVKRTTGLFLGRAPVDTTGACGEPVCWDKFEYWDKSKNGWQRFDDLSVPQSILPRGTLDIHSNFSLANLTIGDGNLWVLLYDTGGVVFFSCTRDLTSAWSAPVVIAKTADYLGTMVHDGAIECLRSSPFASTDAYRSLCNCVAIDPLSGPAGVAGASLCHGQLYMPKILARYSSQASSGDSVQSLVLYWTVSTLVPYYTQLMRTTFVPPHVVRNPPAGTGGSPKPVYDWPPGSNPGGAPWLPGDSYGDVGQGLGSKV